MAIVSVIIPVYNCESYIEAALNSVRSQTEKNVEIIVVDDGSTDSTYTIVQKLAAIDSRIINYTQSNSGRPAVARNRGLLLAKGEFICFLDGDDLYHPKKIGYQLNFLLRYPFIHTIFHDVYFMTEDGTVLPTTYLQKAGFRGKVLSESKRISNCEYICKENLLYFFMCTKVTTILMSSIMIRKKRLNIENKFFLEDLIIGEDVDLWFRIVKTGNVAFMDKTLSYYRQYKWSVTKKSNRNLYDPVKAHILNYGRTRGYLSNNQRKLYRQRISKDLFDIGYTYYCQGKIREARKLYLQSLKWQMGLFPLKGILKSYLSAFLRRTNSASS